MLQLRLSRRTTAELIALALLLAAALIGARSAPAGARSAKLHPTVADYYQVSSSETPPTEAQCESVGRRCFTPQAIQSAYNVGPLYDQGLNGSGMTIAVVDSWGSDTIAHDLHIFNRTFGLAPLCGEEGVTCATGMPWFKTWSFQGSPATKPPSGQGPHLEDKSAWALEVTLDVEVAHAIAPGANILLVTVPTAETLGVQGLPLMMQAEQYLVDHHMANVISQSFGTTEEAFGSKQSIESLRYAFKDAAANGVTVLASSGDGGTANGQKQPVGKGGSAISGPTVNWPASDPLVTSVGGTNLCTDPTAPPDQPRTIFAGPPAACQANHGQAEVSWVGSGGGFSHVFSKPDYQSTLPTGSTPIADARGVPDIGFQASSRTGALIYITLPPRGQSGLICPDGNPCSTGWYDIGGTSLSCPQWAGLVAIAGQIKGGGLGLVNPALYSLASDATTYANDFFDVTTGNNQANPSVPGYPATPGWDPVTGLGTPNAANLLPDLAAS